MKTPTVLTFIAASFLYVSAAFALDPFPSERFGSESGEQLGQGLACSDTRVAVGAPYRPGVFGAPAGALEVFDDANDIAAGTPSTYRSDIEQYDVGGYFGYSTEFIGDVDGDGLSDFAVGEPGYNRVHVFYYGPDGASVRKTILGPLGSAYSFSPEAGNGAALASVQDADIDGNLDLAVSWPGNANSGIVSIYPVAPNPSVLNYVSEPSIQFFGTAVDGQRFGASLAGLRDLDGDGTAELAVGIPSFSPGAGSVDTGRVLVFHANPEYSPTPTAFIDSVGAGPVPNFSIPDALGSNFGASVASAGDLDGDGVSELVIGSPGYSVVSGSFAAEGRFVVYDGASLTTALPKKLCDVSGTQEFGNLGRSVRGVGDVNGDGRLDFVVAASGLNESRGSISVYSYDTALLACELIETFPSSAGFFESGKQFGISLAGEPSLTEPCNFKDPLIPGAADLVVGTRDQVPGGQFTPSTAPRGSAYFIAGTTPSPTPTPTPTTTPTPTATSTPTVTPSPTPTSLPSSTATSTPTAASSPAAPTPAPERPTATPTDVPAPTPVSTSAPTSTPLPEPTVVIESRPSQLPRFGAMSFRMAETGEIRIHTYFDRTPPAGCSLTVFASLRAGQTEIVPFAPVLTRQVTTAGARYRGRRVPKIRKINGRNPFGRMFARLQCGKDLLDTKVFERRLVFGTRSRLLSIDWPSAVQSAFEPRR